MHLGRHFSVAAALLLALGCAESDDDTALAKVQLKNGFADPALWTICESSYLGASFGPIPMGQQSKAKGVKPGIDYVLMVAAWDDPECKPENMLPIASKNEEEVVDGQTRTIMVTKENHQGPCPPSEGIQPIPQALYDRILELWPDYGFQPYETRTQNTECL